MPIWTGVNTQLKFLCFSAAVSGQLHPCSPHASHYRHAYASALLVTPCVNNGAVGKQTNASAEESAIVQPSALGGSRDSVKGFASRLSNFCASFARVVFRLSFPLSAFRILQFFGFLFLLLPRGTLAPHAKKLCAGERAVSAGRILTANPQSQTACCWHWHWH